MSEAIMTNVQLLMDSRLSGNDDTHPDFVIPAQALRNPLKILITRVEIKALVIGISLEKGVESYFTLKCNPLPNPLPRIIFSCFYASGAGEGAHRLTLRASILLQSNPLSRAKRLIRNIIIFAGEGWGEGGTPEQNRKHYMKNSDG